MFMYICIPSQERVNYVTSAEVTPSAEMSINLYLAVNHTNITVHAKPCVVLCWAASQKVAQH